MTPYLLSIVQSLRAQRFNIKCIVTIFPSTIENTSGIDIVSIKDFTSIKPAPEYVLVFDGWGSDFKLASHFIKSSAPIISLADQSKVNWMATHYDYYMSHMPDIYEVYSSLRDVESRRVFCGFLMARISGKLGDAVYADTPQYICEGFIPRPGSIVIDGGACDGATAPRFIERGCKVIGFEMDKKNFELAAALGKQLNFTVENLGLGSSNCEISYTHVEGNIGASHLNAQGNDIAKIVTLDSYAAEHNLPSIDFIKLDVEGAELDVLKGAAQSIKKWKPKLALSAYHKIEDPWELLRFVRSLRPDYEFAFRHYAYTRADVPFLINENTERLYASLGVECKIPSLQESVLFCR